MCKFDPCMFFHEINQTPYKNLEEKLDGNTSKINNLENMVSEKDETIQQLKTKLYENSEDVKKIYEKLKELEKLESVNADKQAKLIESLEKLVSDANDVIEEKINSFLKNSEETMKNNSYDLKIQVMERKIYILDKRRLRSDFCEHCDQEFKLGCQKDRQAKQTHIREMHTFECNVCELKHENKE